MFGYTKEELCLIWLDSFTELEYKHKKMLLDLADGVLDATTIVNAGKEYLVNNLSATTYSVIKNSLNVDYIKQVIEGLERRFFKAVTFVSKDYPKNFEHVDCPPLVLYTRGDVSLLNAERLFSIVGSRKTLPQSLALATDYAKKLSSAGFVLVTGIAQGVDETVIKTVLEGNGKVISIIAGGIDNIYPQTNQKLVDKIAKNGLIISENLPEVKSLPYMFPVRNRLIAGLSKGTLVVSAGKKSGTLWTANYAVEYGKDLFAIPYSVDISSGEGCNQLIKQGASLTDTPQDILDYYGVKKEEREKPKLSPEQQLIIKALGEGGQHVEKLAEKLGKRAFEITPILSIMEINGLITKAGNIYQLTRSNLED